MPYSFEQSKDEVAKLVKHFITNQATYRAPAYKEAHARQEFIDPLFMALNWDVQNRQRAAPDYREVIAEDSVDIEGQRKAPDYAFRVGRERKFFAEAKKPGVDLKSAAAPAYQLRRYAWSAKLPLSLLTDFEELAVYDCRLRPAEKDKPSVARVNYLTCEEYADRWRDLWEVFSRDAVWGGSFDQYTQTAKGKRGTSEVDAEFLKEIEGWRDALARNLALRNARLTIDELNDAVQRIIDRLIFLRMAEDRGIEDYGQLQRLAEGEDLYAELLKLARKADAKYNSGLFDFSKAGDTVTPKLAVDDKTLRPILSALYYPQSPYEFSVLPAEILGNIYEQFLGKTIRLTAGHNAKVEEKPEVKKAGGVYYTPAYIVEYIVRHTVGKQIEGKSPKQLRGFRVLDPACGSGSFLLGAYKFLLDYYQTWHIENSKTQTSNSKRDEPLRQVNGEWRLTTAEKKRILTEHIFGVDIDRQAVEVTKLSLLLKVLEGESDETLGQQLRLFQERALPNLDHNIKCGNSLIGPEYFSGQLLTDPDELRRVNPFDWAAEFPEVFKRSARPLWFVTFVTHNSRVSERMVTYGVQSGEPLVFSPEDQMLIAEEIFDVCQKEGIAVVAANVLPDHVHLVIAAEDDKALEEHIRKIKGGSSFAFQRARGWEKGSNQHVWAQKFNRVLVADQQALTNILEYVNSNHLKHVERWGEALVATWDKGLKPLVQAACVTVEEACQPVGGFDCVIGNPPYIRIQTLQESNPAQVAHLKQHYRAAGSGNYDIYVVFVEKGLSLLHARGRLGFILPHKFFNAKYGEPLRGLIANGQHLAEVIHFGDQQVFAGATTYTCLMFLDKRGASEVVVEKVLDLVAWADQQGDKGQSKWENKGKDKGLKPLVPNDQPLVPNDQPLVPNDQPLVPHDQPLVPHDQPLVPHDQPLAQHQTGSFPAARVTAAEWNFAVGAGAALFEKLSAMPVKLGDVAHRIYQGPITSADSVFLFKDYRNENQKTVEVFSKELDEWVKLEVALLKRVIRSGSIGRYWATPTAYVLFPYSVSDNTAMLLSKINMQESFPLVWAYLERNKIILESREKSAFKDFQWYRFGRTQNLGMWEQPKLLVPYMITELSAYPDLQDNFYFINVTTGGYGITIDESQISYAYLCGLLNSRLLDYCLKQVSTTFHGGYFAANKQYIEQLPIRPINFSNPEDKARHDRMVSLVEQMLDLHQRKAGAKDAAETARLQRLIDSTDQQIDALVYELYGLSAEEIAVVEGGSK